MFLLQAFLSQPNPGKYPAAASYGNENCVSPHGSISQSPMLGTFSQAANGYGEIQRLREELSTTKSKLQHWEESIAQARNVSVEYICDGHSEGPQNTYFYIFRRAPPPLESLYTWDLSTKK